MGASRISLSAFSSGLKPPEQPVCTGPPWPAELSPSKVKQASRGPHPALNKPPTWQVTVHELRSGCWELPFSSLFLCGSLHPSTAGIPEFISCLPHSPRTSALRDPRKVLTPRQRELAQLSELRGPLPASEDPEPPLQSSSHWRSC